MTQIVASALITKRVEFQVPKRYIKNLDGELYLVSLPPQEAANLADTMRRSVEQLKEE